jgi:DNA segregation ATPase FtsK/SpoIIIE-like protein
LFLDPTALNSLGLRLEIEGIIDWNATPHVLLIGPTGTGKSYLLRLLLGRVARDISDSRVWVCDFKKDDGFRFLQGCPRYYGFTDCLEGFELFCEAFRERQSGAGAARDFMLLAFDEYAAFLNHLEKKEAESCKKKMATLLMLGRSLGCHVLISQQRGDAEHFATARDNFSLIVALGNISKESRNMFGFDSDRMIPATKIGMGHALINGNETIAVQTPPVRDEKALERAVILGVSR